MDKNRSTAFKTLIRIEKDGAYSNIELNRMIGKESPEQPGFVREIVYGVIRSRLLLDHYLEQLLRAGTKGTEQETLTILRMGLYQLMSMGAVPGHAAVDSSVELAKMFAPERSGLVNAVLRNFIRKKDELNDPREIKKPVKRLSVIYSFDRSIVRHFIDELGESRAENVLKALNVTPKLCVQVNGALTTRSALSELLGKNGLETEESPLTSTTLYVKGNSVIDTEEFRRGLFFVQDEASAVAIDALGPEEGDTVIDVCAAPGGKSFAAASRMRGKGKICSFDLYPHKIELIRRQAERLGLGLIQTDVHDALTPAEHLLAKADKVICDVPCSGLGVIARKPEIKYRGLDTGELCGIQLDILKAASGYLRPGGRLMYSTCTINTKENGDIVRSFLDGSEGFELLEERQLMPDTDGTDGFYFAILKRKGGL